MQYFFVVDYIRSHSNFN